MSKLNVVKPLHETIEFVLAPAAKLAERGISVRESDGCAFCGHLFLTKPKILFFFIFETGSQTYLPFHVCVTKRETFGESVGACCRSIVVAKLNLSNEMVQKGNFAVECFCQKRPMSDLLPALSNFPFIGIHSSTDIYAIFCIEPMHISSVRISKLLKSCVLNMLNDPERTKSSILAS